MDFLLIVTLEPNPSRKEIFLAIPSAREFASQLEIDTTNIAAAFPAVIRFLRRKIEAKSNANFTTVLRTSPLRTQFGARQLERATAPIHLLVAPITIEAIHSKDCPFTIRTALASATIAFATHNGGHNRTSSDAVTVGIALARIALIALVATTTATVNAVAIGIALARIALIALVTTATATVNAVAIGIALAKVALIAFLKISNVAITKQATYIALVDLV
jgi:hypothetical protein